MIKHQHVNEVFKHCSHLCNFYILKNNFISILCHIWRLTFPLYVGFDCILRKRVKRMWKRGRSWPGRRCWSLSQKKTLKSASMTSTPQRKVWLLFSLNDGFSSLNRRVQQANSAGLLPVTPYLVIIHRQVSASHSDRRGIMRWHGKSCWRRRRSHSETSWTICTPETHPGLSAIMNTIWRWVT